jgi:hypothetical protein
MIRRRRRNPIAAALWVNAALLGGLLLVLAARDRSPMLPAAFGQAQPAIAGGAGLFITPAQFSGNVFGIYLMDVDQQTLCAYTVTGSPPQLKLLAARNFRFDRRLGNYNISSPSPAEVKELVEKEQASGRVTERPETPPPSPEKP